ncbi:hypothetical protein [Paenibacillus sp. HW567]|uniref:hypothetical protein n=1 Tax=Paenibacillus sp. HW567 TaxID=1034769 RepID=UPI00035C8E01|nr:hypothetical protein [Paenibacillus sp. HW567]
MKLNLRYLILFCFLLFLSGCQNSGPVTEKELDNFINSKNLEHVSIQKLNSKEYYIFSSPDIYVYRSSSEYSKSSGMIRDKIVIGGLEKGSIGLIINNAQVLRYAKTYTVMIDGKIREYEYTGEKYLIIKDYRIWNPTAQLKITFLNDRNEEIFATEY